MGGNRELSNERAFKVRNDLQGSNEIENNKNNIKITFIFTWEFQVVTIKKHSFKNGEKCSFTNLKNMLENTRDH